MTNTGIIKVSVIVPCYNVENYVSQCLDGALTQTLREIEVICVNDGSTDGTLAILQEYAARDDRVVVLDHANAGYGFTMNRGIAAARGEYVAFLESDDYIKPHAYATLYADASQHSADIVKGDYYDVVGEGDRLVETYRKLTEDSSLYGVDLEFRTEPRVFYVPMMNVLGLFRTDFLRRHEIRHNETPGAAHQDIGFWFQTIALARSIRLIQDAFYCYRKDNPNSSIHNRGLAFSSFDEYEYARGRVAHLPLWAEVEPLYWHRFACSLLFTFPRIDDTFRRDFLRREAEAFAEVVDDERLSSRFSAHETSVFREIVADPEEYYFTKVRVASAGPATRAPEELEPSCAVSVVVPVFNSAQYLEECLDSLLAQDFADFEVICVDDDSTDESLMILLGYERRDHRVRVLRIPHGGQSVARNRALREVGGRYVYFLDSDDKLAPGALRTMVELADKRNTEILFFDGQTFFDSPDLESSFREYNDRYRRPVSHSDIMTGPDMFAQMYRDDTYRVSPCLALIRHDFLRASRVRFLEGIIFEDNHFMFTLLMQAGRVSHENAALFMRRIRENSTVTSVVSPRQSLGYFACWVEMTAFAIPYRWPESITAAVIGHLKEVRRSAIVYGGKVDPAEVRALVERISPLYLDLFLNTVWPPMQQARRAALAAAARRAEAAASTPVKKKPDTRDKELARLRKKNASLTKEVRMVRESTSFRIGSVLTRVPGTLRRRLVARKKAA